MVDNIKTYFRLMKINAKMDFLWLVREPRYFFLYLVCETLAATAMATGVMLIAGQFADSLGASSYELLFMQGFALMVDGVFNLFFINNNIGRISRVIGRGQLDHFMIQPVPIITQLLTGGFAPASGIGILIIGVIVTIISAVKLNLTFTVGVVARIVVCLTLSLILMVSIIYIVSTSAFYSPVASEEIADSVVDFLAIKAYPLNVFPKLIQIVLTTILPVGLTAWYPSMYILGVTSEETLRFSAGVLPCVTAVFVMIAVITFRKGMIYYATNGSPRYSSFGHR